MAIALELGPEQLEVLDRKSTRLNSSHRCISYAVFCLKKKKPRVEPSRANGCAIEYPRLHLFAIPRMRANLPSRSWAMDPYSVQNIGQFFINDTATTEIYTLSLHDALPI